MKKILLVLLLLLGGAGVSAKECYEASIMSPTPFMGNNGEVFKLSDGTLWEVKYEYEYLYEYNPTVLMCPARGKMSINGKMLNVASVGGDSVAPSRPAQRSRPVQQVPQTKVVPTQDVVESQIDGDFNGWEGETIVKLSNGQIWQQSEYYYHYRYAFMPNVLVYRSGGGYKMRVDGVDKAVGVKRLR
jgi:hypothetical protein